METAFFLNVYIDQKVEFLNWVKDIHMYKYPEVYNQNQINKCLLIASQALHGMKRNPSHNLCFFKFAI